MDKIKTAFRVFRNIISVGLKLRPVTVAVSGILLAYKPILLIKAPMTLMKLPMLGFPLFGSVLLMGLEFVLL